MSIYIYIEREMEYCMHIWHVNMIYIYIYIKPPQKGIGVVDFI